MSPASDNQKTAQSNRFQYGVFRPILFESPVKFALTLTCGGVIVIFAIGAVLAAEAKSPEDNCVTCHLALGVEKLTKPAELYKVDIHAAKGFGCVACNGGDGSIIGLETMHRKNMGDVPDPAATTPFNANVQRSLFLGDNFKVPFASHVGFLIVKFKF